MPGPCDGHRDGASCPMPAVAPSMGSMDERRRRPEVEVGGRERVGRVAERIQLGELRRRVVAGQEERAVADDQVAVLVEPVLGRLVASVRLVLGHQRPAAHLEHARGHRVAARELAERPVDELGVPVHDEAQPGDVVARRGRVRVRRASLAEHQVVHRGEDLPGHASARWGWRTPRSGPGRSASSRRTPRACRRR